MNINTTTHTPSNYTTLLVTRTRTCTCTGPAVTVNGMSGSSYLSLDHVAFVGWGTHAARLGEGSIHIMDCLFVASITSDSDRGHFYVARGAVGTGNQQQFKVRRSTAADAVWKVTDSSITQVAAAFQPPTPMLAASILSVAGSTTPHAYIAAAIPLVYAPKRAVRKLATSFRYGAMNVQ